MRCRLQVATVGLQVIMQRVTYQRWYSRTAAHVSKLSIENTGYENCDNIVQVAGACSGILRMHDHAGCVSYIHVLPCLRTTSDMACLFR